MVLLFLCLKIFICRIIDVALGTVKTIVMVKGKNTLAALIAFIEGSIWFLVVREALLFESDNTSKWIIAIAYAGGYAVGTYTGVFLANKFVTGMVSVRVVTSKKSEKMLDEIRESGYAITVLDINNSLLGRKKYMILSEIKNSQLEEFKELIYKLDSRAFVNVNETKFVYNGFFKK